MYPESTNILLGGHRSGCFCSDSIEAVLWTIWFSTAEADGLVGVGFNGSRARVSTGHFKHQRGDCIKLAPGYEVIKEVIAAIHHISKQ